MAAVLLTVGEEILLREAVQYAKTEMGLWDPDDVDVELETLTATGVKELQPMLVARWSDGVVTSLKLKTYWPEVPHP